MTDSNREPYVIHGFPRSLFTRKLEAAFAFYGLPMRSVARGIGGGDVTRGIGGGDELGQRAGTHQIPILETPEGWALADTTPILGLLDARVPARRLFPTGELGVLVHVVEEILDEWFVRVMVHYRWHYPENAKHMIEELTGSALTLEEASAHPMAKWGPRACRATGTEHPAQQKAAETEYLTMLDELEAQLASTRFALGDRPTAVDAILLGGLHAHTNADPIPDLSGYPRVLAWAEGGAAAMGPEMWGALEAFPESTPFARHVLAVGAAQYAPFVVANAAALEAGEKVCQVETYGEPVTYLARPYPEASRQLIQDRIVDQLSSNERANVEAWLGEAGLACFLP